MDKTHIACLLAGAAVASACFLMAPNLKKQQSPAKIETDF